MKCKVCGRELDPQKNYCDKCGTPIGSSRSSNGEFSWNTIDFPKPKAVKDIDMNWGADTAKKTTGFTNRNLSEGFVSGASQTPQPKPAPQPQPVVQQEAPANMQQPASPQPQVQPAQPQYAMPQTPLTWTMPSSAWNMPAQQQVVIPQPYGVQPQPISTAAPVISPMPQMPQGIYNQPLYVTQPIPTVQYVAPQPAMYVAPQATVQTMAQPAAPQPQPVSPQPAAPAPQPQPAAPAPQPVQPQPIIPDRTEATADELDALDNTFDERVASMPVAAAAVKNPVNVDEWLDNQLKDSTPVRDDRFFTFYKKNEDFQKLLDEEYEKYKDKYNTNAESLKKSMILSAAAIDAAAKAAVPGTLQSAPAKKEMTEEDDVRKVDRAALNAAQGTEVSRNTVIFDPDEVKTRLKSQKTDTEMDELFGEPVTEFDRMMAEGTTDADTLGDSTLAISNEDLRKEIDNVAKKVEEAYGKQSIALEAYDRNKRRQHLQDMASAREDFFNNSQPREDDTEKLNAQEIRSIFDEWDKERQQAEERKPKKKHRFGKFLLTLILLIALLAGADFACIKLMPEGSVRRFFENLNYQVMGLYGQITGKEVAPEQNPAEMTLQEKAANEVNKNIEIITFDTEGCKFESTGKYGIPNLGSKDVVSDEQVIADLTKVIVAYDSSWIDYVNGGEDISCFDYLKTDGAAFREASHFDRLGKEETFKRLNIGEVRQDSNNYYVFASELIRVKSGSTSNDLLDNLVYRLALVGDKYMIVDASSNQ